MEILRGILLVLHIVGFGVVLGGMLAQLPAVKTGTARITAGILHASWLLLATGLGLVAILEMGDEPVNHMKIGIKLIVLLVIVVLVIINKKKEKVSGGVFGAIAGLAVLNVALAVLWS